MEEEYDVDLEDGEIEDIIGDQNEAEEIYIPLERPQQPVPVIKNPSLHSDSGSEPSSESETDSDGGSRIKPKPRPKKVYRNVNAVEPGPPRKKSYSIWCTDAAEDNLTKNMINCNVERRTEFTRDVETYNPSLVMPSNKRNHSGDHISTRVKMTAKRASLKHSVSLSSRDLAPLVKTINDPANELAEEIAAKLSEEKVSVIENVIQVLGKEMAINFYQETAQVEQNGGLLIMNGARRRTPGGVYFHLVKYSNNLTPDQIREIFKDDRRQTARDIKKSKAAQRKEAISKEDYPTLLSRAEAAIYKKKQIEVEEVRNPPPSPATDGRENSNSSCDVDPKPYDEMDV